jgi:hypothetical protein
MIFSTLGSKYSYWWMVGNPFSLLRRDTVYNLFPFESVSLPAGWYFSTLRVEIFLLVDGLEILFSYAGDTVYAAFPFESVSLPAGWYFSTLRVEIFLLVDGWNPFLYYAGIQSTQHPIRVESVCQLVDIFYPWVEIFLLVDGWKSFSLLRRDTVYAASPVESVSLPAGWYFSTLRVEIFLLVDGWKSFFFITRIQSTQHPQSSRVSLPAGWYFSTLRVEIFLLVDGWKSFFFMRDTVYAASPFESVSLPAGWYFLPLGSNILAGGWLEILFFITQGYSLRSIPSRSSQSASWMIFFYP